MHSAREEDSDSERQRGSETETNEYGNLVGFYMKCQGGAILKIFHTQKYYSLAEVNKLARNRTHILLLLLCVSLRFHR